MNLILSFWIIFTALWSLLLLNIYIVYLLPRWIMLLQILFQFKSVLSSCLTLHILLLLCWCHIWLDEKAGINLLNHQGNYLLALSCDSDELASWNRARVYYYQSETALNWQHSRTCYNISASKHIMASNVSGLWRGNFTTK